MENPWEKTHGELWKPRKTHGEIMENLGKPMEHLGKPTGKNVENLCQPTCTMKRCRLEKISTDQEVSTGSSDVEDLWPCAESAAATKDRCFDATLPQMGELLPNETSHGVRYQLGHSAILAAAFVTYACSHTLPAK